MGVPIFAICSCWRVLGKDVAGFCVSLSLWLAVGAGKGLGVVSTAGKRLLVQDPLRGLTCVLCTLIVWLSPWHVILNTGALGAFRAWRPSPQSGT